MIQYTITFRVDGPNKMALAWLRNAVEAALAWLVSGTKLKIVEHSLEIEPSIVKTPLVRQTETKR